MNLTHDAVQRFVGGEAEIHNEIERYLYRGEIERIAVDGVGDAATLKIKFAWSAKGEGIPEGGQLIPMGGWVKDDDLEYGLGLMMSSTRDIGPGSTPDGDIGGDNRLRIEALVSSELIILYPPNGSKLDRSKVRGLKAA